MKLKDSSITAWAHYVIRPWHAFVMCFARLLISPIYRENVIIDLPALMSKIKQGQGYEYEHTTLKGSIGSNNTQTDVFFAYMSAFL